MRLKFPFNPLSTVEKVVASLMMSYSTMKKNTLKPPKRELNPEKSVQIQFLKAKYLNKNPDSMKFDYLQNVADNFPRVCKFDTFK